MSQAPPTKRPIVYIVDPDDAVRDSLRSLLGLLDFPVETFATAEQLLERGDLERVGCVVTEARLTGRIRGTELASRLRKNGCEIPVIVISGSGDVPLAVEALRDGAFDFIEKPFVDRILIRAIERAVGAKSQGATAVTRTDASQRR